jgi:hypothetical protein
MAKRDLDGLHILFLSVFAESSSPSTVLGFFSFSTSYGMSTPLINVSNIQYCSMHNEFFRDRDSVVQESMLLKYVTSQPRNISQNWEGHVPSSV